MKWTPASSMDANANYVMLAKVIGKIVFFFFFKNEVPCNFAICKALGYCNDLCTFYFQLKTQYLSNTKPRSGNRKS